MRVLLDSFSKQERALFLDEHKKEQGNGFLLRRWIGHRPIHPRRHRSWHQQTTDLRLLRPLVVSGFDLHHGRHPRQELPNHAYRHRATPITRETAFSPAQSLSACTRRKAALRLSTARRAHESSPYRREPLLLLITLAFLTWRKSPPLSPPHLPAGCDRLCLHITALAHRPQSVRSLKNTPTNPSSEKHKRTDLPTHFP